MQGRDFLGPARTLAARATEADWRGAVVHAYYALFLECRDILGWGVIIPRQQNVHSFVRLRFAYATDADLKAISDVLEELGRLRNLASYTAAPRLLPVGRLS